MEERLIRILLVEDNEADVSLTRHAFKQASIRNQLHVVRDGDEALSFLRREGHYAAVESPDLVLLDLNLPGTDGRDVLKVMKADRDLRRIPVVVLTSSAFYQDIVGSYDLHANAYVVKPVNLRGLIEIVKKIEGFWLGVVKLPSDQ